jgi:hypothetical protein
MKREERKKQDRKITLMKNNHLFELFMAVKIALL